MKLNKNTANAYTYYEKYNKKYYVNSIFFYNHLELNHKSFWLRTTPSDVIPSHQYFHDILQLIYQLTFSYIYSFYNLKILQHHMIYNIHIHNYLDSKYILYHIFLCQSILCIHICIYLHSIFVYYHKHLHLIYISIYKFHANLYTLFHFSLILD